MLVNLFSAFLSFRAYRPPCQRRQDRIHNQRGDISTLNGSSLKLVDNFTYIGSSVSSTETDINTRHGLLSIGYRSYNITNKTKRSFFQAAVVSILLYGCTTWTLIKLVEKKLDGNYIRMPRAILNKSWRQHPTKQQLYGHLPHLTNQTCRTLLEK